MLQFVILHHLKTSNDDARVRVTVQCVRVCVCGVYVGLSIYEPVPIKTEVHPLFLVSRCIQSHTVLSQFKDAQVVFLCAFVCVGVCMYMQETDDNSPSSCGLILPELKFIQAIFQVSRKAKHAFVFTVT